MLSIGIIGYGYWGPNILRNFQEAPGSQVLAVCDLDSKALQKVTQKYPKITCTTASEELIQNPNIDAIAIITPVSTHYELAKQALKAGKHVFVEKPFTSQSDEAKELIDLGKKKNLKIMVDHTFLFTPAVRKIKELMDFKTMGDLIYYDSTRINLGLLQDDINVIWDLGPHDFSIHDFLIPNRVLAVSANGAAHFGRTQEDVAYVTSYLENDMISHFNFNWLSPVKVRKTMIGGRLKKLVWDDLRQDEKIKIYDKGVQINSGQNSSKLLIDYRVGDMHSPKLDHKEALALEVDCFNDAVQKDTPIINDGEQGLRIVQLLEATDKSLRKNGEIIHVQP